LYMVVGVVQYIIIITITIDNIILIMTQTTVTGGFFIFPVDFL